MDARSEVAKNAEVQSGSEMPFERITLLQMLKHVNPVRHKQRKFFLVTRDSVQAASVTGQKLCLAQLELEEILRRVFWV